MSYHEKKEEKSHPLLKPAISVCKAYLSELFNNLPQELLRYIAGYMNFSGIKNFLLTNKSTYKSFFENRFWQRLWQRDFYYEFKDNFQEDDDPEKIYKERYFYWQHRRLNFQRQMFIYKVCALPGCEKSCDLGCGNCKEVFYCSEDHFNKDLEFHQQICEQIKFVNQLKCPLSGNYFIQPSYIRHQPCNHALERGKIIKHMDDNVDKFGFTKCPYPGCKERVEKSVLESDIVMLSTMAVFLHTLTYKHSPSVGEEYLNLMDDRRIISKSSVVREYYKRKTVYFRLLYLHSTGNKESWFSTSVYREAEYFANKFREKYFPDTGNRRYALYYRGREVNLDGTINEIGITDNAVLFFSFGRTDLTKLCAKYRKKNMKLAKHLSKVKPEAKTLKKIYGSSMVDDFGCKRGRCAALEDGAGADMCCKKAEITCANCQTVSYCSPEHQRKSFNIHRIICGFIKFTKKLKCPLTDCFFMEPVITIVCKHRFEKAAILRYFGDKNTRKCPYKNCGKDINKSELKRDFFMERMIATFCYLLAQKKTGWKKNLEGSNIINQYSRLGLFFGRQNYKIRITVKHLGKSAKNFEEKELSCSLVSTVKGLVHYFYELNKQEIDPYDPPVAVFDGEEIDLTERSCVCKTGIHDGSSLILFLKSDNELDKLYKENERLLQQWRQTFQGN